MNGDHVHKVYRCEGCEQVFCPECDLPAGAGEVSLMGTKTCGVCLDLGPLETVSDMKLAIIHLKEHLKDVRP